MLCVLCSLLLAGGMVGCAPEPDKQTATYMDVFDTVTTVTVCGVDAATFAAQQEQLHGFLSEYHRLYDVYNSYPDLTNLKTVNDAAGGAPVAVDDRILDLLEYGVAAHARTRGRVNILSGSVLRLWHDRRTAALDGEPATLPDAAALAEAGKHVDITALVIDRAAGTVQLTDPAARLDVGAIAKGFVAERAAAYVADTFGWTAALLSVGGNIRAVGGKTATTPFTVGIQNPDLTSAQAYLCTVGVRDMSVVTSGDYQRYYTVDGQRYAHIIDMDTLYPATYMQAVTVLCRDSALADELSTALFTMPVEQAVTYVSGVADAEALFVLTDGSLRYTAGFEEYIQSL